MTPSDLERTLYFQLRAYRLAVGLELEYRFHETRKWRFDFAWPDYRLAVEVDGGTWASGRHTRGVGYEKDCEKRAEAAIAGWRIMNFTGDMVQDGRAVAFIARAMEEENR